MIEILKARSGNCCELCGATENLSVYTVPPARNESTDDSLLVCATCLSQIQNPETMDSNHWRCLNDSMWSEHRPVKIMAWRLLNRLKNEGWSLDLLNMMYLDEEEFKRALLFLRRAFADFTSNEKHDIAENIAEIWGLNKYEVSAVVNKDLEKDEKEIVSKLEEFDFDDI